MPEQIKELSKLRETFNLTGELRIEPTPFYSTRTKLPIVLFNKDKTIGIEVGSIVSGSIAVFRDFAHKANELITLCEGLLNNNKHAIKSIAIYAGVKPNTDIQVRCIEVKNKHCTSTGFVKTMDDIKRFINEDIYP